PAAPDKNSRRPAAQSRTARAVRCRRAFPSLGQMGCRCAHAFPSLAAATPALCSGNEAGGTGLTVECGESRLDVRVTDDQPPATGNVPTRRRLFRQVDTSE